MALTAIKNDWVDLNTPGHTETDWKYTSAAHNTVANAINALQLSIPADYVITKSGNTITATPSTNSGLTAYSGTDAYTVIQAAINALIPSGANGSAGGKIYIGPGTYDLTNELVIVGWEGIVQSNSQPNSQLIIQGAGYPTFLQQNTSGKNGLVVKNCANIALYDFRMYAGGNAKSCILGDDNGATSELSMWKSMINNVQCWSQSSSYPSVLLKNFFWIWVGSITIIATAHDGMVLQQTKNGVEYGNSYFGLVQTMSGTGAGRRALACESTVSGKRLVLLHFGQVEALPAYYGIYLRGVANINFSFVDLEDNAECVMLDAAAGYETNHVSIDDGYYQTNPSGTGIHIAGQQAGNNRFAGQVLGTSVKAIDSRAAFKGPNKYRLAVYDSPRVTAAVNAIDYRYLHHVRIDALDGTIYDNMEAIEGATEKTTAVTGDVVGLGDSADNYNRKRLTLFNLYKSMRGLKSNTVTSSGTLTMTIASNPTQTFTGTAIHTVVLPTTSVVAGMQYTICNQSTQSVSVQSSNTNAVATVLTNTLQLFVALKDTPVAAGDWRAI